MPYTVSAEGKAEVRKQVQDGNSTVELYVIIYNPIVKKHPPFNNYNHWAFSMHHSRSKFWHSFEASPDKEKAWVASEFEGDPRHRYGGQKEPLIFLGSTHRDNWAFLQDKLVPVVPIGSPTKVNWTPQDYVTWIWHLMYQENKIEKWICDLGFDNMLGHFGPILSLTKENRAENKRTTGPSRLR